MIAGSIVKLITSYILIGIPGIGLYGAPIGTFACYLTIVAVNFYFIAKHIGLMPSVRSVFVRPFLASLLCAAAAIGSYLVLDLVLPSKIATLTAIFFAAVVYFFAIFLIRAVGEEDILLLPKGKKINCLLHRMKLIR